MRPRNETSRHGIVTALRTGPLSAQQIADAASVSPRTALRLIAELEGRVIFWGQGARRRYALRRRLRGHDDAIPLYRIDSDGRTRDAGSLSLIQPEGSHCDLGGHGWPVADLAVQGLWEGLPYPLYDMCPQGFLGRLFAQQEHGALEVSSDPRAWSDDDIVWVLSRRGADQTGDLILGTPALRLHHESIAHPVEPIASADINKAYPRYADAVLRQQIGVSSAAGEYPKFTASRQHRKCRTPHVIVKFSGQMESASTQRWADLLVCEHLALQSLRDRTGIPIARSRILQVEGRTFLESERFDRMGDFGRVPLVSLHAINGHLSGLSSQDWRQQARTLHRQGFVDATCAQRMVTLWWFGTLIGNTDMHLGNLSFFPQEGRLLLAPAYDMLPMAYAPMAGGELPPRQPRYELPPPDEAEAWKIACGAALEFWRVTAADVRVSSEFRRLAQENRRRLQELADRV